MSRRPPRLISALIALAVGVVAALAAAPAAVAAPGNPVIVSGDGTHSISLAWTNGPTPNTFVLMCSLSDGICDYNSAAYLAVPSVNDAMTLTMGTTQVYDINSNLVALPEGYWKFRIYDQLNNTYSSGTVTGQLLPVPGAPTSVSAVAGDAQASVTFTAPSYVGTPALTSYTVTSSPGGLTGTGSSSPITVSGLTNGTTYSFTVVATNTRGNGTVSALSGSVTPKAAQTITFNNPGTKYFGTSPTLAASATSSLAVSFTSATTGVCTITTSGALTFVTGGTCTINANQAGNGTYSPAPQVQQSFTVAPVAPSQPTIGVAVAGDGQVTVSFTASASNGGASITGYTVTSNPGGVTASGSSSPITVSGLSNGTSYTFTVTATNSAGTSLASAATSPTTPRGSQTITFTNPGTQNFGTSPTLAASATSSLAVSFTSATTGVCTITSGGWLTFVTAGSCTINANQAGDSAYTAAAQVQQTFTVAPVAPDAPGIGAVTAGDGQATVAFTPPLVNGGASITGYTVTASPGGASGSGSSSPVTVTGLTNGTAYTFTVTATNIAGTGNASSASNSSTPLAGQTITFTNPGVQNFGTAPTLSASASSTLAVSFTSATTGVCTITTGGALTFVTAGSCTINADQAGDGTYSPAPQVQQTFTVAAVAPGAPTAGAATAGDGQVSVAFTAPASNGGASITGYTVTSTPGGITGSGSVSPITVSGLTNGTAYTFTVTATNPAGTGIASSATSSTTPLGGQTITFANPGAQTFGTTPTLTATASSTLTVSFTSATAGVCTITTGGALTFVTAGTCTINADQAGNGTYLAANQVQQTFSVAAVVPGAPTIGVATAGSAAATVAFTPPASTGGAAITGYTVTSNPGGLTGAGASSPITVSGLTNGTAYTFTVTGTNSAGTSAASASSNPVTPAAAGGGGSSQTPSGSTSTAVTSQPVAPPESPSTSMSAPTGNQAMQASGVPAGSRVSAPTTGVNGQPIVTTTTVSVSPVVTGSGSRAMSTILVSNSSQGSVTMSAITQPGGAGSRSERGGPFSACCGGFVPATQGSSGSGSSRSLGYSPATGLSIASGGLLGMSGGQGLAGSTGSAFITHTGGAGSQMRSVQSTQVPLGTFPVASDGTFSIKARIPGATALGKAVVEIAVYTPSGDLKVATFPVTIRAASDERRATIVFAYRSAALTTAATKHLKSLAARTPAGVTYEAVAVGLRSRGQGTPAGRLAAARAKAVARAMAELGITTGYGTSPAVKPLANRANSRRVDIAITYAVE